MGKALVGWVVPFFLRPFVDICRLVKEHLVRLGGRGKVWREEKGWERVEGGKKGKEFFRGRPINK